MHMLTEEIIRVNYSRKAASAGVPAHRFGIVLWMHPCLVGSAVAPRGAAELPLRVGQGGSTGHATPALRPGN